MADLTRRELQVLRLMSEGASNALICRALWIEPKTLETHVRHIYAKLELEDQQSTHRRVAAVLAYLAACGDSSQLEKPRLPVAA